MNKKLIFYLFLTFLWGGLILLPNKNYLEANQPHHHQNNPSVCPAANVKAEWQGNAYVYEYTDNTAAIGGNKRCVNWTATEGYVVAAVCIKYGQNLINPDPSQGQWCTNSYDISHIVITTAILASISPSASPSSPLPSPIETPSLSPSPTPISSSSPEVSPSPQSEQVFSPSPSPNTSPSPNPIDNSFSSPEPSSSNNNSDSNTNNNAVGGVVLSANTNKDSSDFEQKQGQVLGVYTMAKTGNFGKNLLNLIQAVGGILMITGFWLNAQEKKRF